jgi:hypothetical protein
LQICQQKKKYNIFEISPKEPAQRRNEKLKEYEKTAAENRKQQTGTRPAKTRIGTQIDDFFFK